MWFHSLKSSFHKLYKLIILNIINRIIILNFLNFNLKLFKNLIKSNNFILFYKLRIIFKILNKIDLF